MQRGIWLKRTHLFPVRPRGERRHRQSTHELDEDERDGETPKSHPEELHGARLLGHGDGEVGRERHPTESARSPFSGCSEPWGVATSPRSRADSRVAHDGAAEAEDTGCFDGPRTAPGAYARVSEDDGCAVNPAEGQMCLDVQHYPPGKSMYLAEVPMAIMKQLFPTITSVPRNIQYITSRVDFVRAHIRTGSPAYFSYVWMTLYPQNDTMRASSATVPPDQHIMFDCQCIARREGGSRVEACRAISSPTEDDHRCDGRDLVGLADGLPARHPGDRVHSYHDRVSRSIARSTSTGVKDGLGTRGRVDVLAQPVQAMRLKTTGIMPVQ
jgi:hypothetical protein